MSRRFSQILKRQTSLNHLCQVYKLYGLLCLIFNLSLCLLFSIMLASYFYKCLWSVIVQGEVLIKYLLLQASRTVIHSADITFQMLEDWRNVDLNSITKQTLYTMEDSREDERRLIIQCKESSCISGSDLNEKVSDKSQPDWFRFIY